MATIDLSTLFSKFLNALYAGTLYSSPLGGTTVGMPVIRAVGRSVAATNAAVASIAAFTVGAADGSFIVSANLRVTAGATFNFTVETAYTDEANAAQVLTLQFIQSTGAAFTVSVVNTNGSVPYVGVPMRIRCKAATTITVRTQVAGTYTGVTYNVEGDIQQVA